MLWWKFHKTQRLIYESLNSSKEQEFYLLCTRRLGKTYMLLALAFEQCLKHPGSRVLFLAPEKQSARQIASDTATKLMRDCPQQLQPHLNTQLGEYLFKNGSILRLKGVNAEQADSLRGGEAHLIILDEAAQMDNLNYLVTSVLMPMTLTTYGRIIYATTPPITPDHDSKLIYDRLFAKNATCKYTIIHAPHIRDEQKKALLRQQGEAEEDLDLILAGEMMPKTTAALRELFAEFVTDASQKVLREFDSQAKREIVIKHPRPEYFDCYTVMDPGFNDRTGILFGYWDFLEGKLVIEDEALLHKAKTSDIAKVILEKEYELWGDKKPLARVSDVDPRLVADLWELHGLQFTQADKQGSEDAINRVRVMVGGRELIVSPHCVQLVHQMENTIWNKKGNDFERTTEGHGDLLAALKYFCRHVNRFHNPYPPGWRGKGSSPNAFTSPRKRFYGPKRGDLDLLGSTPFAKRVKRKRGGG